MQSRRTFSLLGLTLASLLFLTACPSRTNIGKINANPDRYHDKEVAIAGRVTDSWGVPVVGGAYKLDDGTGEIWIINRGGGVPTRGSRVGVRGYVHSGLNFAGRNFGTVLEESEHRTR